MTQTPNEINTAFPNIFTDIIKISISPNTQQHIMNPRKQKKRIS